MSGPPRIAAIVPVKPSGEALRRLAGVLDPLARRALQAAMLDDVLGALRATPTVGEVLVVTADPVAAARAGTLGARVLPDHDPPRGMNAAVAIGLTAAARAGADAGLVLTADLPLADPAEVAAVIAAAPPAPGVVLVPSRDGTGTNALLIRPPGAIRPRLGPDSRARHLAAARRAGLAVVTLELPGLALDIDLPDDLAALVASGVPSAGRAALVAVGASAGVAR